MPINSEKTSVYLYGYDEDTYTFQAAVNSIAQAIGVISLLMAFVGLFMPFGKLIII